MRVAIHQPHYFPWVGYFDKIAKSDIFVILDEVQLEKGSQMVRNRVLDEKGFIRYITISGDTKGFLERKYNELPTKEVELWTNRQINALTNYYRKANYWTEIFSWLEPFFEMRYGTICEYTCTSIRFVCQLLGIKTPMVFQSELDYDRTGKRSDLVYNICQAVGADIYLSGRGASIEYLNQDKFFSNGIHIIFQDFHHPIYPQVHPGEFIPGVSILDMLFNCGIEYSRHIFWENIKNSREFITKP